MRSAASEKTQKFVPRPSKLAPRGRTDPDRISLTLPYRAGNPTSMPRNGPPRTEERETAAPAIEPRVGAEVTQFHGSARPPGKPRTGPTSHLISTMPHVGADMSTRREGDFPRRTPPSPRGDASDPQSPAAPGPLPIVACRAEARRSSGGGHVGGGAAQRRASV